MTTEEMREAICTMIQQLTTEELTRLKEMLETIGKEEPAE